MTDGLGAGFAFLTLLGVLVGVAVLLGATAATALALRRVRGGVPVVVPYLAVGLLVVAVLVAGFGVLALYDEAWLAAALLVALVWAPLALVAARTRLTGAAWRAVGATAALAWWLPFLAGVAAAFVLSGEAGRSPAASTVAAGIVAGGGALLVGESLPGEVVGRGTAGD